MRTVELPFPCGIGTGKRMVGTYYPHRQTDAEIFISRVDAWEMALDDPLKFFPIFDSPQQNMKSLMAGNVYAFGKRIVVKPHFGLAA
jgi:hypothetical protein